MNKETRAVLMVADISGFTKFMKSKVISISHGKQVIVRLLKAIIKVSKSPLKIAELEGDAVFFYAVFTERNSATVVEDVKMQILKFFEAFKSEIDVLTGLNTCSCEACQSTRNLKLKIVIHIGVVEFEKINKIEKLFGIDVIVVHRMLKNSVPSKEYVMISENAQAGFDDFFGLTGERFKENLEGIGEIEATVYYPADAGNKLNEHYGSAMRFGLFNRMSWKAVLDMNTLMDWIRIKKIKGSFKHEMQTPKP